MTKDHNFSADQDTQPIDSLPSSPSDSGDEKDSWIGNRGDEPFQDDAWINDEYMETQVIIDNDDEFLLCRETQAVDLGFGTQEEPFVDDDQLLQGFDGLATQVLDRSDDDVTVYLVDNSEVSGCCGDPNIGGGGNLLTSEDKSSGEHAGETMKPMGALDSCRVDMKTLSQLERWRGSLQFVQQHFVLLLLQPRRFSIVTLLL